jgi:hypothetical protein
VINDNGSLDGNEVGFSGENHFDYFNLFDSFCVIVFL